jgi:hypothetical protein
MKSKNNNRWPGIYNRLARKTLSFPKELENPIGAIKLLNILLGATISI